MITLFSPFLLLLPLYLHITIHHLLCLKHLILYIHIMSKNTNTICCVNLALFSVYVFRADHLVLDNKTEGFSMGETNFPLSMFVNCCTHSLRTEVKPHLHWNVRWCWKCSGLVWAMMLLRYMGVALLSCRRTTLS